MKKTLIILVLLFSSSVYADDISDFEIEGMSIGDSILDYFSITKIDNAKKYYYEKEGKKLTGLEFKDLDSLKLYDNIQITYNNNYKIYGITGLIFYENINECHKKQNEIAELLSNLFQDAKKSIEEFPHTRDKSGKSTIKGIYFDFISGGYAQSSCYDWSDESQYYDHLRVGIITKEFQDLL